MLRETADVLVIGAGLAGLACARRLEDAHLSVTVVDKARGPGGRMSTRRGPFGTFDHGAQYFTARHEGFRQQIEHWHATGVVQQWMPAPKLPHRQNGNWVGSQKMSALPRYLSSALVDLRLNTRVGHLDRSEGEWKAFDADGNLIVTTQTVVLAIPGPQAADLLRPTTPRIADALDVVMFDPCWAAMVALRTPLNLPKDIYRLSELGIGWAARENSKPGRSGDERWTLHATANWTEAHFAADAHEVGQQLWRTFAGAVGVDETSAADVQAHRWRYAKVSQPLGRACLFSPEDEIGACGDWCLDARVEAAWESGEAMADAVVQSRFGLPERPAEPSGSQLEETIP